jgi:hypothetical protein
LQLQKIANARKSPQRSTAREHFTKIFRRYANRRH